MLVPAHDNAPWDVLYVAVGSFFFVGAVAIAAKVIPQHERPLREEEKPPA